MAEKSTQQVPVQPACPVQGEKGRSWETGGVAFSLTPPEGEVRPAIQQGASMSHAC